MATNVGGSPGSETLHALRILSHPNFYYLWYVYRVYHREMGMDVFISLFLYRMSIETFQ